MCAFWKRADKNGFGRFLPIAKKMPLFLFRSHQGTWLPCPAPWLRHRPCPPFHPHPHPSHATPCSCPWTSSSPKVKLLIHAPPSLKIPGSPPLVHPWCYNSSRRLHKFYGRWIPDVSLIRCLLQELEVTLHHRGQNHHHRMRQSEARHPGVKVTCLEAVYETQAVSCTRSISNRNSD